MHVSEHLK